MKLGTLCKGIVRDAERRMKQLTRKIAAGEEQSSVADGSFDARIAEDARVNERSRRFCRPP